MHIGQTHTHTHAGRHAREHTHAHTHTLPDLAYKNMCVCEKRKLVSGAHTYTCPAGPVLGTAVTCTT